MKSLWRVPRLPIIGARDRQRMSIRRVRCRRRGRSVIGVHAGDPIDEPLPVLQPFGMAKGAGVFLAWPQIEHLLARLVRVSGVKPLGTPIEQPEDAAVAGLHQVHVAPGAIRRTPGWFEKWMAYKPSPWQRTVPKQVIECWRHIGE